jgi:hypothetical protein
MIRQGQTTARVCHARRVVHARIRVRKTKNRADYLAKVLEENGDKPYAFASGEINIL